MLQIRECTIQELQLHVMKEAQKFILKDEKILLCSEHSEQGFFSGFTRYFVFIITEKQLLTLSGSKSDHISVQSEPLDRFLSVSQSRGSDGYVITVAGRDFYFYDRKDLAGHFAIILKQAIEEANSARFRLPSQSNPSSKDIAEQLTKLIELRKNDLISEEEFVAAKRKLLD